MKKLFNKIIDKLDKKLVINQYVDTSQEESVMLTVEETFRMLMSVDGMTEELAGKIIFRIDEIMEGIDE